MSSQIAPSPGMEKTTFKLEEYDVTDTACQIFNILTCPLTFLACVPGVLGSKKITLTPEEAVLEYKCLLCSGTSRRAYGELGSVDKGNCCCCVGLSSDLTKGMLICPGMGCDGTYVDEIVGELKSRMKQRGDTGNIQRAEQTFALLKSQGEEIKYLRASLDAIMKQMNVAPPSKVEMVP